MNWKRQSVPRDIHLVQQEPRSAERTPACSLIQRVHRRSRVTRAGRDAGRRNGIKRA